MITESAMTSRNSWSRLAWLAPILPLPVEETTDNAIHPRRLSPADSAAARALQRAAQEQRLAEVYSPGMPVFRLAAEAECGVEVAKRWLGVAQRKRRRRTDQFPRDSEQFNAQALARAEFERRFAETYVPGISATRLAAQAGCSQPTARRWIAARERQQRADHPPASNELPHRAPIRKCGSDH